MMQIDDRVSVCYMQYVCKQSRTATWPMYTSLRSSPISASGVIGDRKRRLGKHNAGVMSQSRFTVCDMKQSDWC